MRAQRVMPWLHRRRGVTLVELMVTLAMLGVLTGVVGLALTSAPATVGSPDAVAARIAALRRAALSSGRRATVDTTIDGRVLRATAFPDGSVVSDSATRVDRLSGRLRLRRTSGDTP